MYNTYIELYVRVSKSSGGSETNSSASVCGSVDLFGRQTLRENRWQCPLQRRGRSTARGRTVRDLVQGLAFPA
jgi:hypothetical protein